MGLPANTSTGVALSRFVAVEFDTYWNSGWDPVERTNTSMPVGDHVGISISSLVSNVSQKWSSNVTGGGVCQAWITYDAVSNNLSVSFTGYRTNTVVRQDGLVYTVDLRRELPEWVIFGFSAATGSLFQKNNVISWSFDSSELQVDRNNGIPPTPVPDSSELQVDRNNGIPPTPVPDHRNAKNNKVGLIVGISVPVILVSLFAFVLWRRHEKKMRKDDEDESSFDVEMNTEFEMGTGPKRFSYHELAHSTGDFAEKEKLGEGAIEYKAPEKQIRLIEWVWELYDTETLLEAVDPSLGSDFDEEQIKRLMIVGLWCGHPDSQLRPSMREAIKILNFEAFLPLLPLKMPVASYLTPSLFDITSQHQTSSNTFDTESSNQTTSSTVSTSQSVSLLHSEKYEAYFMEKYEEGLINPRFDEGLWSRASGGKNKGKLYGFNNVDDPSALINGIPSTSCSSTSHGSGIQDTEIQRLKGIIEGLVAEKEIEKAEKQSEKAEKEREKTEKESMHERLTTIEAMLKLVLQNLPSSS
ncbi:hypothetical protein QVD17_12942 [Tagetes erecta]|uniref:non-specific serine/threonine protein kinase n=1 Tax=Tagetes erecta TaxID=13708 RepID=A0AAD8L2U2_TARER|nr:hypothetical protein QVD17_12942 [Tagetes erecta]